jgi:leucine-rich repeat protein SHOC2
VRRIISPYLFQDLNVMQNELTDLPVELGQLTQLHRLGLKGNRLLRLPKEFGNLSKLVE